MKVRILQHYSCYMFRAFVAHHEGAHYCTRTVFCAIVCAFVGSNCNNRIIMHGMENVKSVFFFNYCKGKKTRWQGPPHFG